MRLGEANPEVIQDAREPAPFAALDQIAAEELRDDAAMLDQAGAQIEAEARSLISTATDSWRQALEAGKTLILGMFPRLESVWTPAALDSEAVALAQCFPDGAGEFFGNKWVALAIASAPLVIGTARVVREDLEAAENKRQIERQNQRDAPAVVKPLASGGAVPYGG